MKRLGAALIAAFLMIPAGVGATTQSGGAPGAAADFGAESPSREAHDVAHWAVRTGDHKGLPFAVVDKVNARLYAFDRAGKLVKTTPVLIGMGVGDRFAPGVMQMDMYDTQPWQRITPAGRFIAEVYEKGGGKSTVWVDYDAGIALHKMPLKKTAQRRAERMASPVAADHRITYGCINVPPAFYDAVIYPAFKRKGGIVYVLPDELPLETVFKSFGVGDPLHLRQTQYIAR
jgi:hypothetical protein